jgi:hypothetical protein
MGYIILHNDVRQIPLRLKTMDGKYIDSFAGAIVRAIDEGKMQEFDVRGSIPCGSYIRSEDFITVPSREIMTSTDTEALKSKLKNKLKSYDKNIFIVGGNWYDQAFKRGRKIDTYQSPVGWIGGVFIHANYVEALVDLRTCEPWGERFTVVLSIFLASTVAILFGLDFGFLRNAIVFIALIFLMIIGCYLSLHLKGIYFDVFIPIVLLFGHISVEKIQEWYIDARKYRMLPASAKGEDIARNNEA